jgi:hypothetical protein
VARDLFDRAIAIVATVDVLRVAHGDLSEASIVQHVALALRASPPLVDLSVGDTMIAGVGMIRQPVARRLLVIIVTGCGSVAGSDAPPGTVDSPGATDGAQSYSLIVTLAGTGTGVVTSAPAGIDCGTDCVEDFSSGSQVVLTATPAGTSTFAGWSGGCSGTMPTCTVNVTAPIAVTATFDPPSANCDAFTTANGTAIPGWSENVGDWVIDGNRMRINQAGGIYSNNVTKVGSMQSDGCGRLTAIHAGGAAGEVVGVVLRWQSPGNYIVALVQDNSGSGMFDSAWLYQMPLADIGGFIVNQTFGQSPRIEACVTGTAVTLRIDANQDGTYEVTRQGTTTITAPGLTGVMSKSDSGAPTNMPLVDDFCWGP